MGKGFFWGGVIGAVTALLLAPKSGKALRDDIERKFEKRKKKGNRIINSISQKSIFLTKRAKGLAKEAKAAASEIFEEAKNGKRSNSQRKKKRR